MNSQIGPRQQLHLLKDVAVTGPRVTQEGEAQPFLADGCPCALNWQSFKQTWFLFWPYLCQLLLQQQFATQLKGISYLC